MALAFSYVRFSSKGRQEQGDSFRRQTEGGDKWIADNGHTPASLVLHDRGVSAFKGDHARKEGSALKLFLDEIKAGRVPKGSILVVEHLDRLSREGIRPALNLFNQILDAGVSIATLQPSPMVFKHDASGNDIGLLIPIIYFYLAHEYSANISRRLKAAWDTKRKEKKFSKRCPSWLDATKDGFTPNDGVKAIKFIFEQAADGFGHRQILRKLAEKFEPIGTAGAWTNSFVCKVLRDRSVLGELQPKTKIDGKRVPVGDMIPDYYPRVISDDLFNRAAGSLLQRKKQKGPANELLNLFPGMIVNAHDGHVMHRYTTTAKTKGGASYVQRRLVSYGAARKLKGSDSVSIDYDKFEAIILKFLCDINISDIEPTGSGKELLQKKQELEGVTNRISELEAQLEDPDNVGVASLVKVLKKLEASKATLEKEVSELDAQQQMARPLSESKSLLEAIQKGDVTLRRKLRGLIPSIVEKIIVKPEKHFRRVYWVAQICYRSGVWHQVFSDPVDWTDMDKVPKGKMKISAIAWGTGLGKSAKPVLIVDLQDRELANKASYYRDFATKKTEPAPFIMPKTFPKDLAGLAEIFLQSIRSKLSADSFKTIPSKVRAFVEHAGEDVSAESWASWIAYLRRQVKAHKLARATARVGLNRTREFVQWLHETGARKRFEVKGSAAKMIP
jgi:DNA invertase Pin-like site-specific DNA recombinase